MLSALRRPHRRLPVPGPRWLGLAAVALLLAAVWLLPLALPDPNLPDFERGLSALGAPLPPSLAAPLGTDDLGRDELARVCVAGRASLITAAVGAAISVLLGLALGTGAGLASAGVAAALMRLVDLALAFPVLLLALFAAAVQRAAAVEDSALSLALILGLLSWPPTARVVYTRARVLAGQDFVVAARAVGARWLRVVARHIVPNLAGTLAVMTTLTVAQLLLIESALSFVGLGIAPPAPSWGHMMSEGRVYYRSAPWLVLAPACAIVLAVGAVHLVGAGLRRKLERAAP